MSLFLPRIIKKKIGKLPVVPALHREVLGAWAKNLSAGIYDSETQNDAEFIQRILVDVLGYVGSSDGNSWTVAKNQPVGAGNVDVALGKFSSSKNEILAPFELKGAKTKDLDAIMPGRKKSPVQQAWEYAMDAKGAKWVLVSNYMEIRLYAVGYGRKDYESFDLRTMSESQNYHRFMLLLSAENLLSGRTFQLLRESEFAEKEVTNELYEEYKAARTYLIDEVIKAESSLPAIKALETAQTILDRVLFIAFAEDKGLLKEGTLKEAFILQNPYNPQPVWSNFKGLFAAVNKGSTELGIPAYNGGLFAPNEVIDGLHLSDETCNLLANLGNYDYETEVSVNILGHIFEQSIADIEEIKKNLDPSSAPAEAVGSKRRTDGIFYTPPFITRYIVEQSVGRWLADQKREIGFDIAAPLTDADYESIRWTTKKKLTCNENVVNHIKLWKAYRERMSKIRVVDPACGSGAFLNEVFDYLFREGQVINRALEVLHNGQIDLFRWDTHILTNNIFGVDINRESVEITKLSLWLKTANRNEKLSYLDDNIKVGNSLIHDASIVGDLAFDWRDKFPRVMEKGGFDVVVGNPPYVDSETMTKVWERERQWLAKNYKQTSGNWDLYVAFLELAANLLDRDGYFSFITPDKWISKDFGVEIRRRMMPGIISILPVGRGVFESALVDSIVTLVGRKEIGSIQVVRMEEGEISIDSEIEKSTLDDGTAGFDRLLSPHLELLNKMERTAHVTLESLAPTENACATSDTYVLGDIIMDVGSIHGYNPEMHYRVANTGTLSRYIFRWGTSPMRYLKNDYLFPVVNKVDFCAKLGKTYQRRSASPKVVIKGITLLDGALDLEGKYVPGKSTLVICSDDTFLLKFASGVVNSKVASFYVRQKYSSASYNGGVVFKPEMINSIPIPTSLNRASVVAEVDRQLNSREQLRSVTLKLHNAIRAATGVIKLRKALDEWYSLDSQKFLAELLKQGVKASVKERAEWIDLFDECRAECKDALTAMLAADAKIDGLLMDAFGLNKAERDVIVPQ